MSTQVLPLPVISGTVLTHSDGNLQVWCDTHTRLRTMQVRTLRCVLEPGFQLMGSPLCEHPVSCTKQTIVSRPHDFLDGKGELV